jgi:hypothetical protein
MSYQWVASSRRLNGSWRATWSRNARPPQLGGLYRIHDMRVAIIAIVVLAACQTLPQPECPDEKALTAETRIREFTNSRGAVIARGREAARGVGIGLPDDPWLGVAHYGEWTYWYPNGQIKARVHYAVTCHTHCCVAGPCGWVHDYFTGEFELWHDSGRRLARGSFVPEQVRVDNNCEGGAITLRGAISPASEFWDNLGKRISLQEARSAGFLPRGW